MHSDGEYALVNSIRNNLPSANHGLCLYHLNDRFLRIASQQYGLRDAFIFKDGDFNEFWLMVRSMTYVNLANEEVLTVVQEILSDYVKTAERKRQPNFQGLKNYYNNYLHKYYLDFTTRLYDPYILSRNLNKEMLEATFHTSTGEGEASHRVLNDEINRCADIG